MKIRSLTFRPTHSIALLLGLLVPVLIPQSAQAATVYWDTNGATPGSSGGPTANGTWDAGTTGNWSTDPTGASATSIYSIANGGSPSTADAIFSAGSNATGISTITVNSQGTDTGVTANSITVKDGAIATATSGTFLSGPVLTLGGGGVTIASSASGASSFNSNTTVGLTTSQNWNNNSIGLFTAAGGISSTAASGTQTLTLAGNATGGVTLSGAITNGVSGGTLAIQVNTTGGGVTTISNTGNTFTGGITLSQGILLANASGATVSVLNVGGLTLAGGELRLNRPGNTGVATFTGANTTVSGNVQVTSEANSALAGTVRTLGTLSIGSQTLTIAPGATVTGGTSQITFGTTTLTGNSTFNVVNGTPTVTGRLNVGALADGAVARTITKTGGGELHFTTAATSFIGTGSLVIKNGLVRLGSASALGLNTGTPAGIVLGDTTGSANTTLVLDHNGTTFFNNLLVQGGNTGVATLNVIGNTGTQRLDGDVTLSNHLVIGYLSTSSNFAIGGDISGTGGGFTITNTGTGTGASTISGSIGAGVTSLIQKSATSAFGITGVNTSFTGTVVVEEGNVVLGAGGSSQLSAVNQVFVDTGGAFRFSTGGNTVNPTIAGLSDGDNGGGTVGINTSTSARTLTLGGSGNYSFSGEIAGTNADAVAVALNLIKTGSGTQTLSGVNTYTGNTTVSAGTLLIEGSLANTTVSVTGGTLGGSGSIAGTVTIGNTATLSPGSSPGTLTIDTNLNLLTGSTYLFEAGDLTNVTGQLDLDNTWTLSLAANANWQLGGTTVLFDYGTIAASPWLTPTIVDSTGLGGSGLTLSDDGSKIYLNGYSVVPEPSTWALLAFSLTTVVVLRRRRKA